MQTYETIFVASPTLTEDEEQETVDTFSQIVTDGGGSFAANERLGRRRLAYPIQKHNDGVYVRFLYDSESAVPKELERRMGLSDRVLRVLTVRMEPKWAAASKEQAVIDARARVEAAEREKLEREEAERKAAEEAARPSTDGEPAEAAEAAEADKAPTVATEPAPPSGEGE